MTQHSLFDDFSRKSSIQNNIPSLDRFQGALLFSTIGDALGWPTEFINPAKGRKPSFDLPVHEFIEWKKVIGGKWWGYEEKIAPGAYSDDTQLAFAVARCIAETGDFEPERFAYEELPLWLQYERGGGKSVKMAARKLVGKNASWLKNFYKQGELDYKTAGANGAAMRNLPIALVHVANEAKIINDSFCNAIITHGHPRAILGTILFGLAVNYSLMASGEVKSTALVEYLHSGMSQVGKIVTKDDRLVTWMQTWENEGYGGDASFKSSFNKVYEEALNYLRNIVKFEHEDTYLYYDFVGALNPSTKGSGLATVCVAIYLFLKYIDKPEEALTIAANTFGSDTDTIGVFLGALLGAYHGMNGIPKHLINKVQDHDYLLKTARRLYSIALGEQSKKTVIKQSLERRDAYFMILAWEIDLHDMFWDTIEEGAPIIHPTLGRGKIEKRIEKSIKRDDYVAKLISVRFDCGQSCVFHSRVQHNEKVSESLSEDIVNALR